MNVYTSVLTSDEVKNLAAEYIILLDLHPCVPPSGLTMNRLPVNKIVATNMSQFLKFSMAGGVRVGKEAPLWLDVEYENERVLAAKRKAQAAKYRAVRKRATTEGGSHRPMKKKTAPLSFALLDSEADESNCSGFGTHYSASPLNTIIPNDAELTIGGDGLVLESANHMREDTDHNLDNIEDTIEVNSPLFEHSPIPNTLLPPTRICMFAPRETGCVIMSWGKLFFWRLTSSSLSEGQSWWRRCWFISFFVKLLRIMYILPPTWVTDLLTETQNQLVDAVRSQNKLSGDHKALQQVYLGCAEKEVDFTKKLAALEKERDDVLDKNQEKEERIKQLKADLASKTSSLTEAEGAASTLKGNLERLTRLLSSDEYKKSLSDVFNLAIAAGWLEGVMAACSEKDAEAILATATDYGP
nr:hypothetical protein [Tanacetum cinerariifolium]